MEKTVFKPNIDFMFITHLVICVWLCHNNIILSCTIYFSIKNNFNMFYTSVLYDFLYSDRLYINWIARRASALELKSPRVVDNSV